MKYLTKLSVIALLCANASAVQIEKCLGSDNRCINVHDGMKMKTIKERMANKGLKTEGSGDNQETGEELDMSKAWECAKEGGQCNCQGTILYGREQWKSQKTVDKFAKANCKYSLGCGNASFGDPAPGQPKVCYCIGNKTGEEGKKPEPKPSTDVGDLKQWISKFPYINQETCTGNIKRLEGELNQQAFAAFNNRGVQFEDPTFPADSTSLYSRKYQVGREEMAGKYSQQRISWKRINEMDKSPSLWGDQGVKPLAVQQGMLGDCWFLSAASALAEYPDRIKKIFTNTEISKEGIYEVKLFRKGKEFKTVVDDRLVWADDYRQLFNSKKGASNSWWLVILEKAYAKINKNFAGINGGDPAQALRDLTGMPVQTYRISEVDDTKLWHLINDSDKKGYVMCGGNMRGYNGLYGGHAYTVLGTLKLGNNKLLKIRNPHGRERYNGPWNDKDSRWTSSYKRQAGLVDANDGTFYMKLSDYRQSFSTLNVLQYDDWKITTYGPVKGKRESWGYNIKSDVDQTVIVAMDYQGARQIPTSNSCRGKNDYFYNIYAGEGYAYQPTAVSDSAGFGQVTMDMKAGAQWEVKIRQWGNKNLESDFMLTVYSSKRSTELQKA